MSQAHPDTDQSTSDNAPRGSLTSSDSPVLVVAAMEQEAAAVIELMEAAQPVASALTGVSAVRGRLRGSDVVVVTTGVGIAAASAAATWAILETRPRAVVAVGSCGGLAADVEVGTVIVGDCFAYSIADATAFGYAPGQVPGSPERFTADPTWADRAEQAAHASHQDGDAPVRRGLMLSGDAFVTAPLAEPMRQRFPGALSADMETTATARTAAALGVPMTALRAVSDLCGPSADQQFHMELAVVAHRSARAVAQLIASR